MLATCLGIRKINVPAQPPLEAAQNDTLLILFIVQSIDCLFIQALFRIYLHCLLTLHHDNEV